MKKKILIIGIIILIIGAGSLAYFFKGSSGIEVEAYKASKGDIKSFVEEVGTVQSDNQRIVYSKVMGEVSKLNFNIGDAVKIGDILIEMYDEETDLQIKSLESKIEALRATYKEATKAPDQETISKAQSNIRTIEIKVEDAQRNADKSKALYDEGAISESVYQGALDNLRLQQEALEVAKNDLAVLQKGASSNIKSQYEAQIADLEYQVDILRNNQQKYTIKSPVDGILLEKHVKEGAYLQPGMSVLELGSEESLYLELDVLASDIGSIEEGAEVNIYNQDLEIKDIQGIVRKIHPKAFSKISDLGIEQKRVKVEVDILDSVDTLKVGYEVDAKIVSESREDVVVIPDNAIFDYEDGDYVFVVEDNTIVLRKVEVGIEGEDMVEVISELSGGENVVISPDDTLEAGINVKIKSADDSK